MGMAGMFTVMAAGVPNPDPELRPGAARVNDPRAHTTTAPPPSPATLLRHGGTLR